MSQNRVQKVEEFGKETMATGDLAKQIEELKRQLETIRPGAEDKVSIIVFSGDLDKVLAAFVIATGANCHGYGGCDVLYFLGDSCPKGSKEEGRWKGSDGEDVRLHAS